MLKIRLAKTAPYARPQFNVFPQPPKLFPPYARRPSTLALIINVHQLPFFSGFFGTLTLKPGLFRLLYVILGETTHPNF